MIGFKLSWLPYILLLTATPSHSNGQIGAVLLLLAVGGGLLYFKHAGKSKAVTETVTKKIETEAEKPAPQVQSKQAAAPRQFCCYCGARIEQQDMFCSSCGQKL